MQVLQVSEMRDYLSFQIECQYRRTKVGGGGGTFIVALSEMAIIIFVCFVSELLLPALLNVIPLRL